jgi:hypothetical protein
MPTTELAWAAGFYDGEGSTSLRNQRMNTVREGVREYKYATEGISQIHPETLERFQRAVGVGRVTGPYTSKNKMHSTFWKYQANSADAGEVLRLIGPWLSTPKQEQAVKVMATVRDFGTRPRLEMGPLKKAA